MLTDLAATVFVLGMSHYLVGHWWPTPLVLAAAYAASCAWWPFRDCMLCSGRGHHRPQTRRRLSRPCWWCKATGKRLRWGRRIYNHFHKQRKAAIR